MIEITPELQRQYQWVRKHHGHWNDIVGIVDALRDMTAKVMWLEFEAEHQVNDIDANYGSKYCTDCGTKNFDPRHNYTD